MAAIAVETEAIELAPLPAEANLDAAFDADHEAHTELLEKRKQRIAQVHPQRTKKEFMQFCQALASAYPEAKKIRLVPDNLNTHNASSFYENLPAAEAFALAQRFEFNYTPKSASWLNMIEIEFSAIARQCLKRRIPTIEQLEKEVLAIIKERSDKQIKINWQFSLEVARNKMSAHYQRVLADNLQYKKT